MNLSRERCEQTELYTDECAHCRGVKMPKYLEELALGHGCYKAPTIDTRSLRPVVALYPCNCPECGKHINRGELIVKPNQARGWRHLECNNEY